jgi:hypothetical protein
MTWKLLARYMANFKPKIKAMFTLFIDEVLHLHIGIRYLEKGKKLLHGHTILQEGLLFCDAERALNFQTRMLSLSRTWMKLPSHLNQCSTWC